MPQPNYITLKECTILDLINDRVYALIDHMNTLTDYEFCTNITDEGFISLLCIKKESSLTSNKMLIGDALDFFYESHPNEYLFLCAKWNDQQLGFELEFSLKELCDNINHPIKSLYKTQPKGT